LQIKDVVKIKKRRSYSEVTVFPYLALFYVAGITDVHIAVKDLMLVLANNHK